MVSSKTLTPAYLRKKSRHSNAKPLRRELADTVEKLGKSKSQYFWQILFSTKTVITCYLYAHLSLIEKHDENTKYFSMSFCLKRLYGVNIFRTTTKREFFNSIGPDCVKTQNQF